MSVKALRAGIALWLERADILSSHLISSHLISSHLVSSRLVSSHLISSHLISSHLISSHPISGLTSTSVNCLYSTTSEVHVPLVLSVLSMPKISAWLSLCYWRDTVMQAAGCVVAWWFPEYLKGAQKPNLFKLWAEVHIKRRSWVSSWNDVMEWQKAAVLGDSEERLASIHIHSQGQTGIFFLMSSCRLMTGQEYSWAHFNHHMALKSFFDNSAWICFDGKCKSGAALSLTGTCAIARARSAAWFNT